MRCLIPALCVAAPLLLSARGASAQAKACPPSDPLCSGANGSRGDNKNAPEEAAPPPPPVDAPAHAAAPAAPPPPPPVGPLAAVFSPMPVPRTDGPRPTAPGPVAPIDFVKNPLAVAPKVDDPQPPWRVFYRETVAARINPLGLISDLRLSARRQLYEPENVFMAENFIGLGSTFAITPAWARGGPFVEIQPLSILTLSGGLEAWGFFKSFGQVQSFPDGNGRYDDGMLRDLSNPPAPQVGTNYSTHGKVAWLEGRLQIKLFQLAMRSTTKATYTDLALRAGDTVYYDQIIDILAPNQGWTVNHDTDFLYFLTDAWIVGARYSFVHSFLPDPAGGPDAAPAADDQPFRTKSETNRLGPIVNYRFWDKPWGGFNQPTLTLLAQWWIAHPYRTGETQGCTASPLCAERSGKVLDSSRTNQAFPLIAVAFSFSGDLIAPKK